MYSRKKNSKYQSVRRMASVRQKEVMDKLTRCRFCYRLCCCIEHLCEHESSHLQLEEKRKVSEESFSTSKQSGWVNATESTIQTNRKKINFPLFCMYCKITVQDESSLQHLINGGSPCPSKESHWIISFRKYQEKVKKSRIHLVFEETSGSLPIAIPGKTLRHIQSVTTAKSTPHSYPHRDSKLDKVNSHSHIETPEFQFFIHPRFTPKDNFSSYTGKMKPFKTSTPQDGCAESTSKMEISSEATAQTPESVQNASAPQSILSTAKRDHSVKGTSVRRVTFSGIAEKTTVNIDDKCNDKDNAKNESGYSQSNVEIKTNMNDNKENDEKIVPEISLYYSAQEEQASSLLLNTKDNKAEMKTMISSKNPPYNEKSSGTKEDIKKHIEIKKEAESLVAADLEKATPKERKIGKGNATAKQKETENGLKIEKTVLGEKENEEAENGKDTKEVEKTKEAEGDKKPKETEEDGKMMTEEAGNQKEMEKTGNAKETEEAVKAKETGEVGEAWNPKETENSGKVKTSEEVGNPKEMEDTGKAKETEEVGITKDTENAGIAYYIEKARHIEKAGKVQDIEKAGKVQDIEKAGKVQDIETAGKVQDIEKTENAKDIEKIGNAQDIEKAGKAKDTEKAGKTQGIEKAGKAKDIEKTGKVKDSERAGKSKNTEKSGRSKDMEKSGKSKDTEKFGKSKDTEKSGKPKDTEKSGKPKDTERSGKPKDTEKSGKPKDTEKSGKSKDTEKSGKPKDTEKSGKPKDTEKSGKPKGTEKSGKPKDSEKSGKSKNTDKSGKSKDTEMSGKSKDTEISGKSKDTERVSKSKEIEKLKMAEDALETEITKAKNIKRDVYPERSRNLGFGDAEFGVNETILSLNMKSNYEIKEYKKEIVEGVGIMKIHEVFNKNDRRGDEIAIDQMDNESKLAIEIRKEIEMLARNDINENEENKLSEISEDETHDMKEQGRKKYEQGEVDVDYKKVYNQLANSEEGLENKSGEFKSSSTGFSESVEKFDDLEEDNVVEETQESLQPMYYNSKRLLNLIDSPSESGDFRKKLKLSPRFETKSNLENNALMSKKSLFFDNMEAMSSGDQLKLNESLFQNEGLSKVDSNTLHSANYAGKNVTHSEPEQYTEIDDTNADQEWSLTKIASALSSSWSKAKNLVMQSWGTKRSNTDPFENEPTETQAKRMKLSHSCACNDQNLTTLPVQWKCSQEPVRTYDYNIKSRRPLPRMAKK